MARKKFSCDFETTTKVDDCRVWAWAYMEIRNTENFCIGNSMDEFMVWVHKIKADLYFHNLKFDGSFIVNWLLKNGYEYSKEPKEKTFNSIISNMGQWYMIDICYGYKGKRKLHTVIYDSLKKLPFTVKQVAKGFKMEIMKGEIDYHKERPEGYIITEEEKEYIRHDVEIIANALEVQFAQGLTKMTNGSDSLSGFKTSISNKVYDKYFPVYSLEMNENIRLFYRGGFTWCNEKYQGKEVGEGLVYDVNSLYPSQMYFRDLPYGDAIFFDGEYTQDERYPLYMQHLKCSFEIKENRIPTIQLKRNIFFKQNEYLRSSDGEIVDLYVTNVDLQLIKDHYDLYDVEYMGGWKFKKRVGFFKEFIDKWMYVKNNNTGAKKLLAKLMLNSLYGKFATNPNVTGKIPYIKEDGSNGFMIGDEEYRKPVYTPMGVFITSWARYTTITTAQKVYDRILYCDTDSIHILGTEVPEVIKDVIDDKKLGYWQHESTFKRAKFLRQKTYVEDVYGKWIEKDGEQVFVETGKDDAECTKLNVKCSGMNDKIKQNVTFENFERGFKSYGSLKPKQVNGGVVLVDSEFTIK